MLGRLWRAAANNYSRAVPGRNNFVHPAHFYPSSRVRYSDVAAAVDSAVPDPTVKNFTAKTDVNLNKMFWSKPCSLALPADSPLRIEEPRYEGIKRFILKLMLFYSKQSKSIRGANVIYLRITSQVDKPAIYNVFSLEKTFKTTFALLVLHMWLVLRRLKEEGKEGVDLGQYLYERYNHDVELRADKEGVKLLLSKWMKNLEKIFYGNIIAYDTAMLPEAKKDELQNVIWRNIFQSDDDDSSKVPTDAALVPLQAMSRYVRRESGCLSLTDKEALFSGNFMFTSLKRSKS